MKILKNRYIIKDSDILFAITILLNKNNNIDNNDNNNDILSLYDILKLNIKIVIIKIRYL